MYDVYSHSSITYSVSELIKLKFPKMVCVHSKLCVTNSNGVWVKGVYGLPEPQLDLLVGWGVLEMEVLAPVPHSILLHCQTYSTVTQRGAQPEWHRSSSSICQMTSLTCVYTIGYWTRESTAFQGMVMILLAFG